MRTVATSIAFASVAFASAQDCPAVLPGSFPDAAMIRAMTCVDPARISGVPTPAGKIDFSDLADISSKGAKCVKTADMLKAFVPLGSGTMTLGASTCSLVSVGFAKSTSVVEKLTVASVEMRMDFVNCTSGPPSASVLMNVVKAQDFLAPTSSLPFLKDVCKADVVTPAPSVANVALSFAETQVGENQCVGTVMASYPNVDKRSCKMLCTASIQKFKRAGGLLANSPDMCTGYAVNVGKTDGDSCHLYKTAAIAGIDAKATEAGWVCFSLLATENHYLKSTPAPPSAAEIKAMEAKLPRLNVNVAPEARSASVLTFNSPSNKCFAPFNVISLQDLTFNTVSVKVMESEWAQLLEMLPSAKGRRLSKSLPVSEVFADRVLYGGALAAVPAATFPGATAPAAKAVAAAEAKAKSKEPKCKSVPPAAGNQIFISVLNTVLGLGVVGAGYGGYMVGKKGASGPGAVPLE